ncbi:hypothetical protein KIW84_012976 [Lathyrus oleraceus]|uniref:TF-B3 domain-containing protein n=1 Tax=Pisum sativum TaxID=3888 RepID=A0A9D5GXD7_PEA|nr:hypothetical protein KIW84_012976 [Pisum sativum]
MKISKQCFGEKQDAIKMINIEDWKGYNCVIHRARRNSYEKNIRHGWYEFAKEKKLEAEDVLYFSMSPPEDFMCFHHIPMKISKQCFGEKQDAIKMINIEDWKGYNCVIHRARRNSYEKNIRHGWYEFAKEKKLEAEDVLYFSMSPPEDFMCFHVIKG